mmetsp:Transcript_37728/g.68272  ORF Transcript_37728/g.68272 Transcript_37728/m.68272 type:complete len:292 (+) Transcript_37728:1203-2078(+)
MLCRSKPRSHSSMMARRSSSTHASSGALTNFRTRSFPKKRSIKRAVKRSAAKSAARRSRTCGLTTLTTQGSPERSVAACTWAIDAEAIGVDWKLEKTSSSEATPRSSAMMQETIDRGAGGVEAFAKLLLQARTKGSGNRAGECATTCATFTKPPPSKSSVVWAACATAPLGSRRTGPARTWRSARDRSAALPSSTGGSPDTAKTAVSATNATASFPSKRHGTPGSQEKNATPAPIVLITISSSCATAARPAVSSCFPYRSCIPYWSGALTSIFGRAIDMESKGSWRSAITE